MFAFTHSLQHLPGTDHDRRTGTTRGNHQHWRQDNHQLAFCRWYWRTGWGRTGTGRLGRKPRQDISNIWHGDQCREDQTDDEQQQRHQQWHQSERRETWSCQQVQVPWVSRIRWRIKARNPVKDGANNSSDDKTKDHLEWQENHIQLENPTERAP